MGRIKQLFGKIHKTRDQSKCTYDQKYDSKIDNQLKYGKKESLNDKMHNIIKETNTGVAFL